MKMEAMFNIVLVERFIASIRKRGEISLPSSLSSKNVETMSTPFLAWIFSQRKNDIDLKIIQKTYELDQKRSNFVVGHSIFEDQNTSNYPELEEKYLKARKIIKSYWPELDCLIEAIGPRVSFLPNDSLTYESSSDPKTFGEIIFNMEHPCVLRWVEILTHEIGHMYLNILLATSHMTPENKSKLAKRKFSNIRQEERPLIGIVHGVFVQAWMMIMAAKVIQGSNYNDDHIGAVRTIDRFKKSFLEDYRTIYDEGLSDIVTGFSSFVDQGFNFLKETEEVLCEV